MGTLSGHPKHRRRVHLRVHGERGALHRHGDDPGWIAGRPPRAGGPAPRRRRDRTRDHARRRARARTPGRRPAPRPQAREHPDVAVRTAEDRRLRHRCARPRGVVDVGDPGDAVVCRPGRPRRAPRHRPIRRVRARGDTVHPALGESSLLGRSEWAVPGHATGRARPGADRRARRRPAGPGDGAPSGDGQGPERTTGVDGGVRRRVARDRHRTDHRTTSSPRTGTGRASRPRTGDATRSQPRVADHPASAATGGSDAPSNPTPRPVRRPAASRRGVGVERVANTHMSNRRRHRGRTSTTSILSSDRRRVPHRRRGPVRPCCSARFADRRRP